MKPDEKTIKRLGNFFKNLQVNEETSFSEVEIFLNDYLDYILKLNDVDRRNFNINIVKEDFVELHHKREAVYKHKCNQEARKTLKFNTQTKPNYSSDGHSSEMIAYMYQDEDVENLFSIHVNKKLCRLKSMDDLCDLISLISNMGHEAEHVVQFIKHKNLIQSDLCFKNNKENYIQKISKIKDVNEKRILIKLIERYIDIYSTLSRAEKSADQKSFNYFDLMINSISKTMLDVDLEQLDIEGKDLTSQTENLNPEEIGFVNFLLDCKGINSAILIGRFDLYLDTEREKNETLEHLHDHNSRNLINLANFIF